MLFGIVSAVRRGEYLVPLAVTAILVVVVIGRQAVLRKHAALLLAPDSSALIQYYAESIRRMPGSDALRAHASAQAAAYYGEFEKAEECLASVDWDGRGGLYEAMPLHHQGASGLLARLEL